MGGLRFSDVLKVGNTSRLEVLFYLLDSGNQPTSPSVYRKEKMSEGTGWTFSLSLVAYNFRWLKDKEFIEIVETIPRRGAVEHMYCLTEEGLRVTQEISKLERAESSVTSVESTVV